MRLNVEAHRIVFSGVTPVTNAIIPGRFQN